MGNTFSPDQKQILLYALKHDDGSIWGSHWRTRGLDRIRQASISRAIRRLENRGLLARLNQVSGPVGEFTTKHRTTHLKLTDKGRAEAERLTEITCAGVNREEPHETATVGVNSPPSVPVLTAASRSGGA
jgi:DNA-binding MarR family transcriptional regulator